LGNVTQHFDFEWPGQLHDPAVGKSKSEPYACANQRPVLLNSRRVRLPPRSSPTRLQEWGGFPYATLTFDNSCEPLAGQLPISALLGSHHFSDGGS